jgi:hypothetical protein
MRIIWQFQIKKTHFCNYSWSIISDILSSISLNTDFIQFLLCLEYVPKNFVCGAELPLYVYYFWAQFSMLIKSEQSYELWSCSKWKAQRWKSKPVKMKTVFQPNWANMSRCTLYIIHQHSRRKSATQFMQRPLASCPFVDFNSARRAVTFTARARGQIKTTKTASAHWLVFALQIGISLYLASLSPVSGECSRSFGRNGSAVFCFWPGLIKPLAEERESRHDTPGTLNMQ